MFEKNEIKTKYFLNQSKPDLKNIDYFTDEFFPPNEFSLFSKNKDNTIINKENGIKFASLIQNNEIKWKRISEIYKNPVLFQDNIDLEDISQGKIGICYLLTTFASLTFYPKLLEQIFNVNNFDFKKGYYEVILFINGEFNIVILDDFIPINSKSNLPFFSKANNNEIWVILLEKAIAKINGGYSNIISGWPSEIFTLITGFSSSFIIIEDYIFNENKNNNNQIKLFEYLNEYLNNKNIIICTTKDEIKNENEDDLESKGLIKGHFYLLKNCKKLRKKNNENVFCYVLENFWGFRDFKGEFGDESEFWNDISNEDRKIFEKEKNQNYFYVTQNEFMKYFLRIDINHLIFDGNVINLNFNFNDETFKNKKNFPFIFNLYLNEDNSNISISLIKEKLNYKKIILPTTLILMKYNENNSKNFSNFNADFNSESDCNINLFKLKKGNYIIFSYIKFDENNIKNNDINFFNLNIICNKNFIIKYLDYINLEDSFELLNHMFISDIKETKKNEIKNDEIYLDIKNDYKNSGIGYRIIINPLNGFYQKWINKTNEIINMTMLFPYEKEIEFGFIVFPRNEKICLAMKNENYGSFWFNLKSSFKNYKTSNDYELKKNNNFKYFDVNKVLNINKIEQKEIKDFYYDYKTINKDFALMRKSYSKEELNNLMIEELKNKEKEIMSYLLELPLYDQKYESNLIWVYIQKENGFYIGQAYEKNLTNNSNNNLLNNSIIREGRGAFKYSNDNLLFVGYWKNNMKNGKGKIYNFEEKNIIFEGEFFNDKKQGKGNLIFLNGDKYEGEFNNDKREGKGIYFWKDGSKWEGIFTNNIMNGKGMFYGIDGDVYEAIYLNGEYIE